LFIVMLGIIWSHLWKQDPKSHIAFVNLGAMLSTITVEGTSVFVSGAQTLIPISYTMLAWALVWRNLIRSAAISSSTSRFASRCPAGNWFLIVS
jgi:hypothetical protein